MKSKRHIVATTTLCWLLGGLFIWAGVVKLSDPKTFARSIDAFGLVPEILLPAVAILLPAIEIIVGLAVLRRWRAGLPAMAALLVLLAPVNVWNVFVTTDTALVYFIVPAGLAFLLCFHIFINAGMLVGLVPMTGITMPFLSYGGSSLVSNMIGIGLALSVEFRRFANA